MNVERLQIRGSANIALPEGDSDEEVEHSIKIETVSQDLQAPSDLVTSDSMVQWN